ncbi:hypothetical protein CR970_00065 [Candidatus Saccharibacteria bacterium]|nr:MAG: hypothetical protein CR970_00065 [Candidatus Saccharibacteria bacterium]
MNNNPEAPIPDPGMPNMRIEQTDAVDPTDPTFVPGFEASAPGPEAEALVSGDQDATVEGLSAPDAVESMTAERAPDAELTDEQYAEKLRDKADATRVLGLVALGAAMSLAGAQFAMGLKGDDSKFGGAIGSTVAAAGMGYAASRIEDEQRTAADRIGGKSRQGMV